MMSPWGAGPAPNVNGATAPVKAVEKELTALSRHRERKSLPECLGNERHDRVQQSQRIVEDVREHRARNLAVAKGLRYGDTFPHASTLAASLEISQLPPSLRSL